MSWRAFVITSAVIVLCASLFLSMQSTHMLTDVYKALHDFAENELSQEEGRQKNKNKNRRDDETTTTTNDGVGKDMNIVLFYGDDWTWSALGFVNKVVKTPNLDAMAKRGMTFPHNCVTTSICWQSRATKSTGLYTAVHQQLRIWDDNMFDKTVMWRQTLYPQLFFAGYHSGFVGKWHAPMEEKYRQYTWDFFRSVWGDHVFQHNGKMRHITDVNREDAFDYLRELDEHNKKRGEKQKFALTIAFYATHAWDGRQYPDQYVPQNYTEHLYDNITIPRAKTATEEHWEQMPWFFNDHNEGRARWRLRFDTPEHYQVSMKRMFRMASEADDVVGQVMDKLKEMGYYDNTMFIFTTDNGNFHGEHGLADKWYPHEESIRVPLIIQDPRMPEHLRGTVNDEFTLNVDLAPTILSAAGVQVPDHMQGRDISQLYLGDYKEAARNWRKDFFYEWSQGEPDHAEGHGDMFFIPAVYALVRKDYKYFYWPQAKYEQLFHIESDPFEEYDIYNDTLQTKAGVLEEVKARYAFLKNLSQRGYPV